MFTWIWAMLWVMLTGFQRISNLRADCPLAVLVTRICSFLLVWVAQNWRPKLVCIFEISHSHHIFSRFRFWIITRVITDYNESHLEQNLKIYINFWENMYVYYRIMCKKRDKSILKNLVVKCAEIILFSKTIKKCLILAGKFGIRVPFMMQKIPFSIGNQIFFWKCGSVLVTVSAESIRQFWFRFWYWT